MGEGRSEADRIEWQEKQARNYLLNRPSQLVYPIMLLPMTMLGIPRPIYLFLLQHVIFSTTMVAGAYGLGREWSGRGVGLIAGASLALYLPIMRTASWAIHDTLFYALLTLFFCFWALALRIPKKIWPCLGLCVAGLLVTRPEGWVVLLASFGVIFLRFLIRFWGVPRVAAGLVLVALLGMLFVTFVVGHNARLRTWAFERIACSFHVSWALFLSTHTVFNDAGKESYAAMTEVVRSLHEKQRGTPALVQKRFAEEGLASIQNNPWAYFKKVGLRCIAIVFPAPFRTSWDLWRRIYDSIISVTVVVGTWLAWRHNKEYPIATPLVVSAIGMMLFIALWGIGGDARHQNAIFVLTIPFACMGLSQIIMEKQEITLENKNRLKKYNQSFF